MENPIKKETVPDGKKKVYLMLADAGMEFGIMIALPLVVFLVLRVKLHKQNSATFSIIGILLALTVSVVTIGFKINQIRNKLK